MSIAVNEGRFSESRDFCFGDRVECSKFTDSNLEGICLKIEYSETLHCVKSVQIWSFSGPYFPVFGMNTKIYGINLRIQSKYGKIRTRETPYLDTFCAVLSNSNFLGDLPLFALV